MLTYLITVGCNAVHGCKAVQVVSVLFYATISILYQLLNLLFTNHLLLIDVCLINLTFVGVFAAWFGLVVIVSNVALFFYSVGIWCVIHVDLYV
jgi:hypothetical protein